MGSPFLEKYLQAGEACSRTRLFCNQWFRVPHLQELLRCYVMAGKSPYGGLVFAQFKRPCC